MFLLQRFQQVEVLARDPCTVVLMLDSPEHTIVCKACQALQQHMEKCEYQWFLFIAADLTTKWIIIKGVSIFALQLSSTAWR